MTDDFSELTRRAAAEQERGDAERVAQEGQEAAKADEEFELAVVLLEEILQSCIAELRRLGVKPEKLYDWKTEKRRKWWRLLLQLPGWGAPSALVVEQKARFWSTSFSGGEPGGVALRNSARLLPGWGDGGRDTPTQETFVEVNQDVEGGLELVTRKWRTGERLASAPLRGALAESVATLAREAGRL